ncbi:MAG: DUF4041 domain-containing protein [Chitinophagaceae bacterium]
MLFFNKTKKLLKEALGEIEKLKEENSELQTKYTPILDIHKEIEIKKIEVHNLQDSIKQLCDSQSSLLQSLSNLAHQKGDKQKEIIALETEIKTSSEKKEKVSGQLLELQKNISERQQINEALQNQFAEATNKYQETQKNDNDLKAEAEFMKVEINDLKLKFQPLNETYQDAIIIYHDLEKQISLYKDTLELSEYGLYQSKFSFDLPEQYKTALEINCHKQKNLITAESAIKCYTEWMVGGSAAEGRKMTKQYTKLMLYAFNGECDGLIAKVKWNNASKTELRILQTFNNVNKLGNTHNILITQEYLNLKIEELSLTYEYEQKRYEVKEEQRQIREQMREEEKAQKEFEKAQSEAEDEERKYQKALDKARQELNTNFANPFQIEALNEKIKVLESNLQKAHEKKERAISLAQMTKVGHIYVISNIGSFGENVYKIGMTRRLDPLERVKELGDASVPFHFDIHAIIYSENAPQLEYELHKKFKDRRINRINYKKEFFRVTLDEIEAFVNEHANAEIEFTKLAEAREYRETLTLLEQLNAIIGFPKDGNNFPKSLM